MDSSTPVSGRRSSRQKKQVERFGTQVTTNGTKRKRTEDEEGSEEHDEGLEEEDHEGEETERGEEEEEEEEYVSPRAKAPPKARAAKRAKTTADDVEKPKPKGRSKKANGVARAPAKAKGTGKGKGKAVDAGQPADEAEDGGADAAAATGGIPSDNHLFNALLSPSTSFQTITEDFLDSLRESTLPALAELVTMVVRCCGAPGEISADEVGDDDGVVGVCDEMMDGVKKAQAPPYPLISKVAALKPVRRTLPTFLTSLVTSAHSTSQLYDTELVPTLISWLTTMSSSSLRSFRHTSTYVAACIVGGLCEVGAGLEKEIAVVGRQREAERRKKGKEADKGDKGRKKAKDPLEKRWDEVKERRRRVEEYLKDFFDGVFVHRFRDYDPEIRAECIREIGGWMKAYPTHFLDGQYLRYIGWVLSDSNTHVRLEALKALAPLYSLSTTTALHHFTTRFLARLIQIAKSDTDVPVRCAALTVLTEVDAHDLWGDDDATETRERERVCMLIWDTEPRVRRGVGAFLAGVWTEQVEEVIAGEDTGRKKARAKEKEKEDEHAKVGVKQLAALLVRLATLADSANEPDDPHAAYVARQVSLRLPSAPNQAVPRISLAVDALWSHVDAVRDWETMLELLLLDHSQGDAESSPRKRRAAKERADGDEEVVDERWRLEEREEGALLEVLGAALAKAIAEAKTDGEEIRADVTRAVIGALPKLFAKHQTDAVRVAEVLLIPRLLELDLYVEMRETKAFEQLWDDITQQFLKHTDPLVLRHAVGTVQHLLSARASLANISSRKIAQLEEELFASLRDAVAGRDELELASFTEDEVHVLGSVASRIACLSAGRDLTTALEEDEGGKQSSAWDILCALAERGRLGYKEEEGMVDQCLKSLNLHVAWKTRDLMAAGVVEGEEEDPRKEALREQRATLLEKLTEFAVGTQSNACEGIRRSSFDALLNMHILFDPNDAPLANGKRMPGSILPLTLDDEVQYRCSGFMQAEIEKYAEEVEDGDDKVDEENEEGSGSEKRLSESEGEEEEAKGKKGKKQAEKKAAHTTGPKLSKALLEREYLFCSVIFSFLRAVRVGVIHVRHSATLLAHYGRFGPAVDQCIKPLIDILREEGIYVHNGEVVALAVAKSVEDAFDLYLENIVHTDTHAIALAKALASAFVVRSNHFAIFKRLPSEHVVEAHRDALGWIAQRLQTYVNSNNKKKRTKAVGFFRVLLPLLATVEAKDALLIKGHMDKSLKDANLELSETSSLWSPQRAYEKRLMAIMAKDKAIGEAARAATKRAAKSPRENGADAEAEERPAPRRQPKPRALPKKAAPRAASDIPQSRQQMEDLGVHDKENDPPAVEEDATPRRARQGADDSVDLPASTPLTNGAHADQASSPFANGTKKRPREEDEESLDFNLDDDEGNEEEENALNALIERGKNGGNVPASQATQASVADIKSRVKRRRK